MAVLNPIFSIDHASMRITEIVTKTMNDDWRWFHMTKKKVKTEFWTEHMNSSINLKKLREIKQMVAEQKISNKWTCSMQVKGYDQTRKATIILLAYNSIHIPLTLCFLQSPSIWVNTYLFAKSLRAHSFTDISNAKMFTYFHFLQSFNCQTSPKKMQAKIYAQRKFTVFCIYNLKQVKSHNKFTFKILTAGAKIKYPKEVTYFLYNHLKVISVIFLVK